MGPTDGRRKRVALASLGGLAAAVAVAAVFARGSPPQLAPDDEVFETVDALFTAVTGRNEPRVGQCEQRLRAYREAGRLSPAAADYLDGVIRKARAGRWEAAAERLYEFMQGQRREGVETHPKPKAKPGKARPGRT